MKLPPLQIASIVTGAIGVLTAILHVDGWISPRRRPLYRASGAAALALGFFATLHFVAEDAAEAVDITKGAIALVAAIAAIYDARREDAKRPVAERWRRFAGATLGLAAVLAYFNGLRIPNANYVHTWDQYHYYMGAKYFPELRYDGLYKCAVVAQAEMGSFAFTSPKTGQRVEIDMAREARRPDRKIRSLDGDNTLVPAADILARPAECKGRFSAERWESYKADVALFRSEVGLDYWDAMHQDHGFNAPPAWVVVGNLLSSWRAPSIVYLQMLASIDVVLLTSMFGALAWAFGWRVTAVAAIVWGCQAAAPFQWTGGSFLRQDWLFALVLSACLAKKRYFVLSGAALATSMLLRVFPGVVGIGWVVVALGHFVRRRSFARSHLLALAGAVIAAAIWIPASVAVCGPGAYEAFRAHTLEAHDRTPLTNHMGLRVLVAQAMPGEIPEIGLGVGPAWGRMKFTKDPNLPDPFEVWKRERSERYARHRPAMIAIVLLFVGIFAIATRRIRPLWIAMCAGQLFVVLLAQLTCYYYSFLILGAPLARIRPLRRPVELSLFGFVVLSQVANRSFFWNDDKYWMLTLLSLGLSATLVVALAPRGSWKGILGRQSGNDDKERPARAGAET
ncbi:MAG: hypothetical protein U0441_28775 [Polyangiaceae bacterium]